jgi:sulfite reductase (NADPH) flavoprotein alpha-component
MTVVHGPLTPAQGDALTRLLEGISAEQLLWIEGYLAGFRAGRFSPPETPQPVAEAKPEITVLFGSQTGNAEKLAQQLRERLVNTGFPVRLESMANYKPAQLKREHYLFVLVSTYGEGDPPDNAQAFHEFLFGHKTPKLEDLKYSVLALGDTSYEHFCKIGCDIDAKLETLGGTRIHPRVDCDVDFEETAETWIASVLSKLEPVGQPRLASVQNSADETAPVYSKKNPYPARLLDNIRLTGRGSGKDVRHIELSLEDSGLSFEPGDALGVYVNNWPQRVGELLKSLGLSANTNFVNADGVEKTLELALVKDYEITTITRPFMEKYAALSQSTELAELVKEENQAAFREYSYGREIIDVVRRYPVSGISGEQLVALLRKLQPRQYSIASSHRANPDEVHLTVAVVRYESHGLQRLGVASSYLADRLAIDNLASVYISSNPNFRLPTNLDAPIIMVGPGTGVAPFRAFLEERETLAARGKNWLFFGDRNFHTDFLYQREWLEHRRKGLLTRLDVAFSRDNAEKLYVQHKLLENSRDLYAWLQEGAYFYVCGDAHGMAPDVHEALIKVIEKEGELNREQALEYVKELQARKRYQRDIY